MQEYIGTNFIQAMPMNRADYNKYRGWELPADENGADEGYLIEDTGVFKQNHPMHKGYISWLPAAVFDMTYQDLESMTFGQAVEYMLLGSKVQRKGWNGSGMWIRHVSHSWLAPGHREYIEMKTVDDQLVPWVASQSDILSSDWRIVD